MNYIFKVCKNKLVGFTNIFCQILQMPGELKLISNNLYNLFLFQPQNILLTSANPLGDIRIVDFGLSRRMDSITEVREILGTPEYVGESGTSSLTLWVFSIVANVGLVLWFQHQRSWAMNPLPLQQTCGKCTAEVKILLQLCVLQRISVQLWLFCSFFLPLLQEYWRPDLHDADGRVPLPGWCQARDIS